MVYNNQLIGFKKIVNQSFTFIHFVLFCSGNAICIFICYLTIKNLIVQIINCNR